MCKEIDIDDPGFVQALNDLKDGDTLIIQGKGGPMTCHTPLYVDPEKEMEEFRKTYDPSTYQRDESWFD